MGQWKLLQKRRLGAGFSVIGVGGGGGRRKLREGEVRGAQGEPPLANRAFSHDKKREPAKPLAPCRGERDMFRYRFERGGRKRVLDQSDSWFGEKELLL